MNDIDMYMPHGGVQGHAGQSTMVEASRAVEEVRALVIVARQFPRDTAQAIAQIRETFSVPAMADRSFYSYPKGGKTVTGSTIHLAKAVAQAWQNITYGIEEMSRTRGQSEMQAWAWDLQTNQRTSTVFIVEHAIDVKDGKKDLTSLRDIYEVAANMGNRRLRAMIESVIPAYVMDLAREVASATLRGGGQVPLAVRIDKAVQAFAAIGVEAEQIEQERGRPRAKWTDLDMAHLRVALQTIQRGEITADDVFPPRALQVADVAPVVPPLVPNTVKTGTPVEDTPGPDEWQDGTRVIRPHPDDDTGLFWETKAPGESWPEVAQLGGGE